MILLAIDTSTQVVGVALYDGYQVLSESIWISHAYHTAELAPAIAEVMIRGRVNYSDLKAVAVALGPGSFTGLRIGLALAKGMAFAGHYPLVGIPTLDFLAAAQPPSKMPMAAILRMGRGRIAVGWYRWDRKVWSQKGEIEVLTVDALVERLKEPTIVCGELGEEVRRALGSRRRNAILASPAHCLRRPSYLAELGWRKLSRDGGDDPTTLSPYYLHFKKPIPG